MYFAYLVNKVWSNNKLWFEHEVELDVYKLYPAATTHKHVFNKVLICSGQNIF